MTDYLGSIALRSVTVVTDVRPRIAALFDDSSSDEIAEESFVQERPGERPQQGETPHRNLFLLDHSALNVLPNVPSAAEDLPLGKKRPPRAAESHERLRIKEHPSAHDTLPLPLDPVVRADQKTVPLQDRAQAVNSELKELTAGRKVAATRPIVAIEIESPASVGTPPATNPQRFPAPVRPTAMTDHPTESTIRPWTTVEPVKGESQSKRDIVPITTFVHLPAVGVTPAREASAMPATRSETTIQVTIGRVEVRANMSESHRRPATRTRPSDSRSGLSEYLRGAPPGGS